MALTGERLESPPPTRPAGWRQAVRGNVLAMGLVSLLTDFSSEMMNPLLPIFIAGLVGGKWAAFWVGLTEGIAEATASLLKIVSGRVSDRAGKRKALVVAGYGASTLARPAMALAGLLVAAYAALQVVVLKFFDRVGKGLRTSPRDALIGDSVDAAHRGLAFSFHRAMDHTGAVLGPLVSIGLLYALLGYARWGRAGGGLDVPPEEMRALRILFALALVPGLAAMVALVVGVREIAPRRAPGEGRPAGAWRQLPRPFYAYVGIVALFALGNSSDLFLLLYGWGRFGLSLVQVVILWIVLHVAKIVFSLPGGVLSDRLGRRPLILAGWAVYALVYLGFALVEAPWQFWTLFVAYGIYHGLTEGVEKALVADFIPSERRATAFGLYHGAIGLAALPASLLFGVFWATIGPRVAFSIGACLAALAAVLLGVLLARPRGRGTAAAAV